MANKTIHELNQATTVTSSHEFAVYDTSNNSTQRASLAQIFDDNEILWADDEDEPISTDPVDFDSADELNPTDTENVTLLTGTDSWSQRFQKISQMFKNIRFILGKLGTTDISSIGNGTVTGALSKLNGNLDGSYFSYCAPNQSVSAKSASNSIAFIMGRRGSAPIVAIGYQNAGTPGVVSLTGGNTYTVSFNNVLTVTSNDSYTYLRVLWG